MKAIIEIEMDSAAFDPYEGEELARILRGLATYCESGVPLAEKVLLDCNGNRVGQVRVVRGLKD